MPGAKKIENPNEYLEIPEWINEKYFQAVLAKDEPNHVKILSFTPVAAIPPGENFTSVMLRIHIGLEMKDGSTKNKTYIFKTMLPDEKGGSDIATMGLFPKELKMYQKYLPAFEALYKDAGVDIQIAPKCLHTEERNGSIHLIFEDLGVKRFKNMDRQNGLDMAHMERVLQILAEYHAASAVYAEKHGPYSEEFEYGFIRENSEIFFNNLYKTKEKAFKKAMSTWGMKDTETYIKNFPTQKQHWELGLATLKTDPDDFNVLIHGDFWSSNLMANYLADGSIDRILLIDFQLCKWGSPAQDLLFLFTISAANDIRLKEYDTFMEIYFNHLIECLKLLKYKKSLPKLRDLHISMYKKNNSFYPFFAVFNHLPVILLPSDKDSNLHSLRAQTEEGEQLRYRLFSNPALAEIMKELYPFFCKRGIFDFSE